jgi:hypothetical protein
MTDIFLSHVEEDASVALEIALSLESAGFTTWCYEVDSVPGPSYLLQTGQAIEQTKVFLLFISPPALASRQVTQEVIRAHESNKVFLPILHNVTHEEFQRRQPEWRAAVGAATSILLPANGVDSVLPRLLSGLEALGLSPSVLPDETRLATLRQTLTDFRRQQPRSQQENASSIPEPQQSAPQRFAPSSSTTPTGSPASSPASPKRWGLLIVVTVVVIGSLITGLALFARKNSEPVRSILLPKPIPALPHQPDAVPTTPPVPPVTKTTQADSTAPPQQEPIPTGSGRIHGVIRLTPGGPALSGYWRIYKAEGFDLGERQQVTYSAEGNLTLPAGHYVVEATSGNAAKQETLEIRPGETTTLEVILNAGRLRGVMKLTPSGPVVSGYWRVYKAEGFDLGERQQVTYSSEADFTLPGGRYVIEAASGNAAQQETVEVHPGETTKLEIVLNAGQLRGTVKLTTGGAEVSGYWRVLKAEGYELGERQQVTYSSEAQFTLPAGRYVIEVERDNVKGQAEVTVQAGEVSKINVILGAVP